MAEVRAVLRLLSMIESPVNKIRRDAALTLLTLLNRQPPDPLQLLFRPELAHGPWEGAPHAIRLRSGL